jgi:hypothetical protein
MTFSGVMLHLLIIVGAGVAGVEYGRRHPNDAWSELRRSIKDTAGKIRRKLDSDDDSGGAGPGAPLAGTPA